MNLQGKVAIVTGAGGGLGGAMALALAEAGAKVAGVDVSLDGITALMQRAAAKNVQQNIFPFVANLGDRSECEKLVGEVIAACGDLTLLVNNAGVGQQMIDPDYSTAQAKPFWETDISGWERIININMRAPVILMQKAVKHFIARGGGRVVNVTTSFDTMIAPKVWAYGQAKAGFEAVSASLAAQLSNTPVTLNILVPGGPANTGLLPANTDLPRDKIIQPPVMGAPIVWLASDDSNGFNNRRIIARLWDSSVPGKDAAQNASAPCAWPGFGIQAAQPK
jgi:NAD(P)-dependent dehydrogenase (short-subunit alcohol dehydrogenase family)